MLWRRRMRAKSGRACAEPPSRPSAPRSGGGAQRRALTAVSTREHCRPRRRRSTTTSCGRPSARNPHIPALANTRSGGCGRRRRRWRDRPAWRRHADVRAAAGRCLGRVGGRGCRPTARGRGGRSSRAARSRRVVGQGDFDATVQMHGAAAVLVVRERAGLITVDRSWFTPFWKVIPSRDPQTGFPHSPPSGRQKTPPVERPWTANHAYNQCIMSTKIPEIARRVSPEDCRDLLEFLLGGPLKKWAVGVSHETINNPTEDQRKQDHVPLSHGRIMLLHSRGRLNFETDWHPRGDKRLSTPDAVRAVYLGAMSDGKIMHRSSSVDCRRRWEEMLKGTGTPAISPPTTPATSPSTGWAESLRNAGIAAGVREAVTFFRERAEGAPESIGGIIEKLRDFFAGG